MSEVCFKEFKGWCKSFTKTEIYLSLVQVIFFISLIALITFLILHFIACARHKQENEIETTIKPTSEPTAKPTIEPTQLSTRSTLDKGVECTWTPSHKTDVVTHYYDVVTIPTNVKDTFGSKLDTTNRLQDSNSDVDIVDNVRKSFLLALVKIRYPRDMLFGCTLTVITNHWTLSAASCIEAIEEVDALDSFVIMERFGEEPQGDTHELSDVIIHPEYRGVDKSYDLVAIKSEDVLIKDGMPTVILPTLIDSLLVTLGERLGVLGFGKFSTEADRSDHRAREVSVYKMMRSQCPGVDTWAARHLVGGQAVGRGVGVSSPGLCAGRVGAEAEAGAACPCGGAPLMRAHTLLGVMSDDGACGLTCRPALYVELALRRDWLDSVVQED